MIRALIVTLLFIAPLVSWSESLESPTVREILEAKIESTEFDPSDRSTPRRAYLNLIAAMRSGDHEGAVDFLDMRYLPPEIALADDVQLVKKMHYVLRRHIWIDPASLSDDPGGRLNDGLPDHREHLGALETHDRTVELFLQRIPGGQGGREWRVSNTTVAEVPYLWEQFGHSEFADDVAALLPNFTWLGLDNWQWAYFAGFVLLLGLTVWGLLRLTRSHTKRGEQFRQYLLGPIGLFVYVALIREFVMSLGLSVEAWAIFDSTVFAYLLYILLAIAIIDLLAGRARRRMIADGSPEAVVIVQPISTVAKTIAVAILVVLAFDNAGFDVTTLIAGLGITSLAVALAAQKTLENVIGAITIYISHPVRPGDFCRFQGYAGTIEEIGLRSTVLRTLDRTVINIPNAMLVSSELENISERDSIRFHRTIALRLSTTQEQLRNLLTHLRDLLRSDPRVLTETVSVRLHDLNEIAYQLRVDCRIDTTDFQTYLETVEELYLGVIGAADQYGAEFAIPARAISVDESADRDSLLDAWRSQERQGNS